MLSPDLLSTLNREGYFTKVSAAFMHKLGYSESEFHSNRFSYFLHPDDLEKSNAAFEKIRNHAAKVNFFRNRFRTKDGRYIWLSWNAIPDSKTGLIYATARDVTEVKKLEQELEQQQLEKQKASEEKLAQLTNLTSSISNEIMKPLNLCMGFTDLSLDLVNDLRESPSVAFGNPDQSLKQLTENLNRVRNYSKNISEIISHMNEIKWQDINEAIVDNYSTRPQSLNRICSESMQLALSTFRTIVSNFTCEFSFSFDQRDPKSRINITSFTKAMISILYNAFDAILLKRSLSSDYVPKITIETRQKGKNAVIRITNNGAPVSDKIKDKIFNPFFTTKDPGDGLGLGLTISHNIIKSLSGTLILESSVQDATTFKIELPVSYQSLRNVKSSRKKIDTN
jgi:PAS domain S-box-containing protein